MAEILISVALFLFIYLLSYYIYKTYFYVASIKPAKLKNKRVIITGASRGIGEELAYEYARYNCRIVLAARSIDILKNKVAEQCRSLGAAQVECVEFDASKEQACIELIKQTVKYYQGIDILVLNHTAAIYEPFFDSDIKTNIENMKNLMNVNFFGYFNTTMAALPYLDGSVTDGQPSQIIAVSSLAGTCPFPQTTIYGTTKHAVQGFFLNLSRELRICEAYQNRVTTTVAMLGLIGTDEALKKTNKNLHCLAADVRKTAQAIIAAGIYGQTRSFAKSKKANIYFATNNSSLRKITQTYLQDRKTGQRFRLNGDQETSYMPEKECLRQDFTQCVKYTPSHLPEKVDLRPWMTEIENQSSISSCTANAMAGAYEYLNYKSTGNQIDVSRLFIYYNSRLKGLKQNQKLADTGSAIQYAVETLEESGVCLESLWPYDIKKVNAKPIQQCYSEAEEYTITEALQVNIDINEMKSCLAQGFPIIVSLNLYKSFDKAKAKGKVPMPKANETSRDSHGRHAVLLSGYSNSSKAFIVRNSWGKGWGDKGYCYVPYDYMGNKKLCNIAWTIKKLAVDEMGEDVWVDEDDINYLDEEDDDDDDDDADIENIVEEEEDDDADGEEEEEEEEEE
ncbi:unnamed protein product [Rotaria socialis]|uniref:Peptidase C1A papain C-terminal domain-containing protein n=1 Tax=Rotaria socialis TaxID=392032 RepID=A0A820W5X8_9BILA|nr:unnamed protein product [Rotaria socialis]